MKAELLKALELDAQGDWDGAHRIVQSLEGKHACWIHAYLHRREGDIGNAGYWYARAGEPVATDDLDAERARIHAAISGS